MVGDGVPVALVRKPGTVGLSSSRWLLGCDDDVFCLLALGSPGER